MTFTLSSAAEADIDSIAEYLACQSVEAALRFYDAVLETLSALADFPGKGRPRDFGDPSMTQVRSWQVHGFENILVFYRPDSGSIRVLRVMHGARDVDETITQP